MRWPSLSVAIRRPSVKDQSIAVASTFEYFFFFINKSEIELQRQTARLSFNFREEMTDFSDMSSIMNEKSCCVLLEVDV